MLKFEPETDILNFSNKFSKSNSTITIHNISQQTIAYKLQSTSPEYYKVVPNLGTIKAGEKETLSLI